MADLVEILLGEPWHGNAPGQIVHVDEGRGAWLRAHGFEKAPEAPKKRKSAGKDKER